MDLHKKSASLPPTCEAIKNDNFGDTTLRLNCFGFGGSNTARIVNNQSRHGIKPSNPPDDGCRLVLGLGPTPSTYCDDYYHVDVNKSKGLDTMCQKHLLPQVDSILKLGPSAGGVGEFLGLDCPVSVHSDVDSSCHPNKVPPDDNRILVPIIDEGSTSAKKSGGYMPSLLLAPRIDRKVSMQTQELFGLGTKSYCHLSQPSPEPSATTDYSTGTVSESATAVTSSDHRSQNTKKCKFMGCTKGARGASGLCIGHGGGQRCQKPGCNKGAESRTAYCKSHGGGNRCQHLGCTKSAEGKTNFCIAHGGGRRCGHASGCNKAARGKSGLCIKHGGGKRCKIEGCCRSAEGQAGLCISHGGGRRCQFLGCTKGAQGSTMFCKAHGGGKRCIFAGCTKGAEGSTPLCKGHGGGKRCLFDGGGICPKSVHGGTNFCVAHGGGKRCAVPGCSKSARGRTDCCVKHGGGKRCKFDNCVKSAQGSTDFCKAHGGGKRCCWGEGKCGKFARGKSGLCAAHSTLVQERETKQGGMLGPGLFHGLVPTAASTGASSFDNNSSSGMSVISDCVNSPENASKRRQQQQQLLIPPQVLVPLSMKSSPSFSRLESAERQEEASHGGSSSSNINIPHKSFSMMMMMVPEGRVHGGGLMSLLGGNLRNASDGI